MDLIEKSAPHLPRLLTGSGDRAVVAFTDRDGGVSDPPYHSLNLGLFVGDDEGCVWENRIRVARAAGFDVDEVALARQVHGAGVVTVEGAGLVGEADVLVTDQRDRPLGILTADCAPVILEGSARIGVVHAGWRGLVAGAVEAGMDAVGDVVRAWVGPSIHACCYEVGPEVVAAFEEKNLPVADGSHVDPARGAEEILTRAGIKEVFVSEVCTHHDERYFSFRRDGITGRQGAFAWMPA